MTAAPDPLVDQLHTLAEAPPETLQRTLVAVAVVHQVDTRGRCHTCGPRWWRPGGYAGTCPTRELLRAAVRESSVGRSTPA